MNSIAKNRVQSLSREVEELEDEVRLVRCGRGDRDDNLSATRAILSRKKLQLKQALQQATSAPLPEWHREGCSGHNH